jgi:hypothetical protein
MNEGNGAVQDFQSRIRELLAPYPHSFAKSRASKLIIDAVTKSDPERPLRFKIFDIIHGFLSLEQKRLGIERVRDPDGYALFKRQFLHDVCYWVPKKDKKIDGIREAMAVASKYNDANLNKILTDMYEFESDVTSYEQRRRASYPRKMDAFGRYLKNKLQAKPRMTEPELWSDLEKDEQCGGRIVIRIFSEEVELDDLDAGDCSAVKRDAVRNRLSRMKKHLLASR